MTHAYLIAVIGSVPIDMNSLDNALAMVRAQTDSSKKEMLLGTIESALQSIPLEEAPREKLLAFLTQASGRGDEDLQRAP